MKKLLLYLTIFFAVFLGTATCIVANGYNSYNAHQKNQPALTKTNSNSTVLTSLASNVLNAEHFGGTFTLTDNEDVNLNGTFAIQNTGLQIIDMQISGSCGPIELDANIQYFNNYIYIDYNNTKIKLSTDDISTAIEAFQLASSALTDTIESTSNSQLPELSVDYLMQYLNDIKITETENGSMIELAIPNLCNLYILTDKNSLPTQILVNNIVVGNKNFTLTVKCDKTQVPSTINEEEFISVSPVVEYIKPTLLALKEDSLGIAGQINLNGSILTIDATLKNQTKLSGKISFGNAVANFELKNDYLLIDFYGKVFKVTLEDVNNLLSSATQQSSLEIVTFPTITPTIKDGLLTQIDFEYGQITGSFDIGKSYFDSISIKETNTKSINDLISAIENFQPIISNEYSLTIDYQQNGISINGRVYLKRTDLSINKLYFTGNILNTPTTIIYDTEYAYLNVNGLKFKISNQSMESVINIAISAISKSSNNSAIDLSALEELNFINNIDFTPRKITFCSSSINAEITLYSNFFKANIASNDISIKSTIYTSSTYKSIAKNFNKNEYKDYSEIQDLISASLNTLENNYIHYKGNLAIDLFGLNVKNIGLELELYKNEKRIELKLTNLPNNSILTYLSSLYYIGQNCHLTITENYVKIYTTTVVRLTGREVVVANKTVPINEFSIQNLYDIMSLRKIYLSQINKIGSGSSSPSVKISTDMLDINKDETILDLTKFVKNLATELTITVQHINSIESISATLNIHDVIKFKLSLTEIQ